MSPHLLSPVANDFIPTRTGYLPEDGDYVRSLSLFGSTDQPPNCRFVPDSLLDYFVGAIALFRLTSKHSDGAGIDWVAVVAREDPEFWGPALPFLAGRLDRAVFLRLLSRLLFPGPFTVWWEQRKQQEQACRCEQYREQRNRVDMASSLLRGRPWRDRKWATDVGG